MTDRVRFSPSLAGLWLVAAPLWMSGAVRTFTDWSLGAGLALATLLVAPLLFFLVKQARGARLRDELFAVALFAGLFGACLVCLYNGDFHGAPIFSGIPDAAHHVQLRHKFAANNPNAYYGCTNQYAFATWVIRLFHAHELGGFNASFYFSVGVWAAAVGGGAAVVLGGAGRRGLLSGVAGFVAAAVLLLWTLVLPHFHYYSSEGFYPQLFLLVPVAGLWVADATFTSALPWLLAAVAGAALARYSYAVHLTELCGALSLIAAVHAVVARGWQRLLYLAGVIGFAALTWKGFVAVRRLYGAWGPFAPMPVTPLLRGMWLLSGAVGVAFVLSPRRRWLRLPLIIGLAITGFMTVAPLPPPQHEYYYFKLDFLALIFLGGAGMLAAADAARALAESSLPRRLAAAAVLVAMACASVGFYHAAEPWRPAFNERVFRERPYKLLKPLSDERAMRRIERVLSTEKRAFGGYLTSWYPTMDFANSTYDYVNGEISFYYGWPPREQPGYCVFWEWCAKPEQCLDSFFPQRTVRLEGYMKAPRRCEDYHPRWDPVGNRTLCWRCY